MAQRTALTDLSWNGRIVAKGGHAFDDKGIPQSVLADWERRGYCSAAAPQPAKEVTEKVEKKEARHGSER